jgi:hypothetical protein
MPNKSQKGNQMVKIKIKDLRKLIKDLPDDINFEIDISDAKIGERSVSTDIRYMNQIELGKTITENYKVAWINIINQ